MSPERRAAEALVARLRENVPVNIALMRLMMEVPSAAAAAEAIVQARRMDRAVADRAAAVERLHAAHPGTWRLVHDIVDGVDHARSGGSADEALEHWRTTFDRLAERSPEAGVALYALGDPALLAAATTEVVDMLETWGVLGPTCDVLDLGCGIGRFSAALAPKVRSVLGIDVSHRMVAEARLRNPGPTLRFTAGSGRDLAGLAPRSFDLVLAADVFPYLVEAGLAERHIADFGRILRPDGTAAILNYSYRGDPDRDRREIETAAAAYGLVLVSPEPAEPSADPGHEAGMAQLFRLWDATVYRLVKPG